MDSSLLWVLIFAVVLYGIYRVSKKNRSRSRRTPPAYDGGPDYSDPPEPHRKLRDDDHGNYRHRDHRDWSDSPDGGSDGGSDSD